MAGSHTDNHRNNYYWVLVTLLLLMSLGSGKTAHAADEFFPIDEQLQQSRSGKSNEWQALQKRLDAIRTATEDFDAESDEPLLAWQREVQAVSESIAAYVKTLASKQEQLKEKLKTLGDPVEGESESIAQQRLQVQEEKNSVDSQLVGYRLLLLNSTELHNQLEEKRKEFIKEKLLARGDNSFSLFTHHSSELWGWLVQGWQALSVKSGFARLSPIVLTNLLVLLLGAAAVGVLLRRKCLRWCGTHQNDKYRYAQMMLAALGKYAPHLMLSVVLALFTQLTLSASAGSFLYQLGMTLPLFFLVWALLHFLFRGEGAIKALFTMPSAAGCGMAKSFKLLALLAYVAILLVLNNALTTMPEAAALLLRDLFVASLVITLFWSGYYLHRLLKERELRGVSVALTLFLAASLIAELSGYRNMAHWLLRLVIGSSLVGFIAWLGAHLLKEFFDGLQDGELWWQRKLRSFFGDGSGESLSWLNWIYVLAVAAVWLSAFSGLLLVWGISGQTLEQLKSYLLEGFQLGSLTIIPVRVVLAILVFALLLAINGWLRGRLEGKWRALSRMERGSREALVTISGYAGIALALLIALSVAGVKFTNLAIIAGALSVGIGFGLQNIVNNFVSGLILLFERPVKTGDWVMVGSTEGYVKRISIRSTLIQTFDRADVIVPNSELISGQVTNWMLYDPRGRIRVPIGVAYGSDIQKVKDLLLEIAAEQPSVITDGSVTEPKVLFLGFGDSSLDFELRVFIRNIDERLQVMSDINFAIDAAFRREGVEIPFPQRDLHLRD